MVCRYCKCVHGDNKEIEDGTEVKIGKSYYHPECAKIKNDIAEIIKLFTDNVNKNVVYSALTRVINDIIFNKKIESGMLLYGLRQWISNKKVLNYPGGLYYVIQDASVVKGWAELNARKIKQQMNEVEVADIREIHSFGYVKKKNYNIADLMEE